MPAHSNTHASPPIRIGFNGELHEPNTGWQLLGNGYRAYSPVLMRFHVADSLSPFDQGDMNGYGYCKGEPINHADPSGHFAIIPLAVLTSMVVGAGLTTASLAVSDKATKRGLGIVGAAFMAVAGGLILGSIPIKGSSLFSRGRDAVSRGWQSIAQTPQAISNRIGKVRMDLHRFTVKMRRTNDVRRGITPFPYDSRKIYTRLLPDRRVQQAYGGRLSMARQEGPAHMNRPASGVAANAFQEKSPSWTTSSSFLPSRSARVGRAREESFRIRNLNGTRSP
jgi:RHS repeat-associated protein